MRMLLIKRRQPKPRMGRRAIRADRAGGALAAFLVVGSLLADRAFAAGCERAAPPTLALEVSSDDVREAFDTTGAELRRAADSRGLQAHWPVLGAYTAKIAYFADIKEEAQPGENGVYCATLSSVRLVISLKGRVIHLARELRADSCLREAVRQHVWRHALADDQALRQLRGLSGQLRGTLGHLQPARAASEEAAKALVTEAVRAQVDEILKRLDRDRGSLNLIVDAPEAIAQLRARCEDRPAGSAEKAPA
jgi:hypothetical protein